MAFKDIAAKIGYPRPISQRYQDQDRLLRFLEGTLYDDAGLQPFDVERFGYGDAQQMVSLRMRRPSVISNFARQFVEQSIGLLWADEQFPTIRCYKADDPDEQDPETEKAIQHLIEEVCADEILSRATFVGAVGSAAIVVRGLADGTPWFEVWRGYQCTPVFDDKDPRKLKALDRVYPMTGEELKLAGYNIDKDKLQKPFWMRIVLTNEAEIRFRPMEEDRFNRLGDKDEKGKVIEWEPDPDNTFTHGFGIVPAVWGKAPNADSCDVDGPCVFGAAVDAIVEIDYQLSQIGRAYKYTCDPMLAISRGVLNVNEYTPQGSKPIKTMVDQYERPIKDATNTIELDANGKAELLEITGQGLAAALEYVKQLREYALESIGGMKSDSETQKGAQSGKALELLYQALVVVVKRLRLAWGNRVLLPLVDLIIRGMQAGELKITGVKEIDPDSLTMRLKWPQWMTPTGADLNQTVQAWETLAGGSPQAPAVILPPDIVTRLAAANFGLQDAETVVKQAQEHRDKLKAEAQDQMKQEQQNAIEQIKAKPAPAKGAK